MIAISQEHYQQLIDLIKCLHSNLSLIFPSSKELQGVIIYWNQITKDISQLYQTISSDLKEILDKNNDLSNENREINEKILHLRL